jgi:hypothetical protein
LDFRTGSIDFSSPLRGSGPRVSSQTVVFPRQVNNAVVGLNGYSVAYSGGDHHIGRIEVHLEATINANTVTVEARLGLRDWSGDWDDDYDGNIDFTILADLASATDAPPRADLQITGMEFNQAVQFFRAASYLDPASVQPDNAIWAVARKNTGVRVYVDWDSGAGLPSISNLTGMLTVQTASTTLTLQPINPGNAIIPRRDSQINMAVVDHTLNFMIPAAWCSGEVIISCEVWDRDAPADHSARYSRTLVFTDVAPLTLYLVGINYQAVNPNIPAPTQAAIAATIVSLIQTYPTGDVIQTGYTTLNFAKSVVANVANGCGSGMNDLLDDLNDLRGSSGDIYLGSLPAGILNSPGNSVGGCAPQGGKTAATFVDYPVSPIGDVPHEVGHALDRHHAPCATGCSVSPADPDPNYPQYGSFRSDSIGVFGFDPTTNTVFPPSAFSDMMAYFFPQWISAYTYNGLRGSSFGPMGGRPSPGPSPHFREDVDFNIVFLGLTVTRDREVTRRPSFNYAGKFLGRHRCAQFTAEFQDANRTPLSCSPLHCDCEAGCDCWPKRIRDVVPFPIGSRWFVLWEGDKKLYEEEIPPEPTVNIGEPKVTENGVILSWTSDPSKDVWYLVHWYDEEAKEWRGVAPRLQETSILIPKRLFAHGQRLRVRVLATPGLGTGSAEHTIILKAKIVQPPKVILSGVQFADQLPSDIPSVLHAALMDSAGRQLSDRSMMWFGDGHLIRRGSQVDLRHLAPGRHTIRLVNRGATRTPGMTWTVERGPAGFKLHHAFCDPVPRRIEPPHKHPHPEPPDPCA